MKFIFNRLLLLCLLCLTLSPVSAQIVRMETVLGNIDIELHPDAAPIAVANFLEYVNAGDYDGSIIHRLALLNANNTFAIQGGSFTFSNSLPVEISSRGTIVNQYNTSNVRGTIAMARLESQPDSASKGWFINNIDNVFLDTVDDDGFTVFGHVINGMSVVDAIAILQWWNASVLNPALSSIPLINYSGNGTIENDLVLLTDVYVVNDTLHINPGLNGSWFNAETSGQGFFFDYFATIDKMFMGWFTFDTVDAVEGTSANLGNINQRWLTGLGTVNHDDNTVTFDLTSTSGGLFDNSQTVTNSEAGSIGTVTITFADCANATVDYDLTSPVVSGSFPITRIVNDNVALCESLSAQTATLR